MTGPVVENPASVPASEGLILGTAPPRPPRSWPEGPRRPCVPPGASSRRTGSRQRRSQSFSASSRCRPAPWITPQDPYDIGNLSLMDARRPPGHVGSEGYTHWLGTDASGRDLPLRDPLRPSDLDPDGPMAGTVALVIGTTLGIVAAFGGGKVATVIMRVVDLQLSFPAILLALVLVALLGQGKAQLTAALVAAQYVFRPHARRARPPRSDARTTSKPRSPCRSAAGASSSATSFRT